MICWTVFALLSEKYEVKDVTLGSFFESDQIAKSRYGSNAYAYDVTQIPVQVGDTYNPDNDTFYHEGNIVERMPTEKEELYNLQNELYIAKNELTTTQLAIVEIYESLL